ncbi:hypothetical protein M3Y99_01254100 [Aphelenchoides fujianensis]|nr:hypothetical protein M3Y99_01254100 [Aphelenchoides fujianensis]
MIWKWGCSRPHMECRDCVAQQPHVGFIVNVSAPNGCQPASIQLLTCRGLKNVVTNVRLTRGHLVSYEWTRTCPRECRLSQPVVDIYPERHDIEVYRAEDRVVCVYRYEPPEAFRQRAQAGTTLAIRHPVFGKILFTSPCELLRLPSFAVAVVAHQIEQLPDCGAVALGYRAPEDRAFTEFPLRPLREADIEVLGAIFADFQLAYRHRQRPDVEVRGHGMHTMVVPRRTACAREPPSAFARPAASAATARSSRPTVATIENVRASPPPVAPVAPVEEPRRVEPAPVHIDVIRSTERERPPVAAPNLGDWTRQNFYERQEAPNPPPPPAARNQQPLEERDIFHVEPVITEANLGPGHDWRDELPYGGDVEEDPWHEEVPAAPLRQADFAEEDVGERRQMARELYGDVFGAFPLDRFSQHRRYDEPLIPQEMRRLERRARRMEEQRLEQERQREPPLEQRRFQEFGRPRRAEWDDRRPYEGERATFRPGRRERRDYERLQRDDRDAAGPSRFGGAEDRERLPDDVDHADVIAAVRSLSGRELYEAMSKEQLCGLLTRFIGISGGAEARRPLALEWPDRAAEGAPVEQRRRHSPPQEQRQRSSGSRNRREDSRRSSPRDAEEPPRERRRSNQTAARRVSPPRTVSSRRATRPADRQDDGGEFDLEHEIEQAVRSAPGGNSRPAEQTRRTAVDRKSRARPAPTEPAVQQQRRESPPAREQPADSIDQPPARQPAHNTTATNQQVTCSKAGATVDQYTKRLWNNSDDEQPGDEAEAEVEPPREQAQPPAQPRPAPNPQGFHVQLQREASSSDEEEDRPRAQRPAGKGPSTSKSPA